MLPQIITMSLKFISTLDEVHLKVIAAQWLRRCPSEVGDPIQVPVVSYQTL